MQSKKYKNIDVFLFEDMDEFNKYHSGEKVKYWRDEDVNEGDWIETDRGGVTKCLKIEKLRKRTAIATIMGKFLRDNKLDMDNEVRQYPLIFVRKDGRQKVNNYFTEPEKQMARLMLMGKDKITAYKETHPDAKRS